MVYVSGKAFIPEPSLNSASTLNTRTSNPISNSSASESAVSTSDTTSVQNIVETGEYLKHEASINVCSFPSPCNDVKIAYSPQVITAQDSPNQPQDQKVINAREKVRDLLLKFEPILRKDHFKLALI